MSLHTVLDHFESKTPKQKGIRVAIALGVLALVVLALMYFGHRLFSGWADSQYLRERDKTQAEVAVLKASAEQHEKNEAKLAQENTLLKTLNEAMAESLKQADTDRERKALADQAQRDAERAAKFKEIDADQDFDSQLRATCKEYAARGFKLSFCEGIQ